MSKIHGQPLANAIIKAYLRAPVSRAFLFHGPTGTGKTLSAHNLADSLGVDRSPIGGFDELPGGEQNADAVRALASTFRCRPLAGDWRLIVVNECDSMSQQAETIWLDVLEHLPPRVVVCFTTTSPEKRSERFIDRCCSIEFVTNARAVRAYAEQMWANEVPGASPPDVVMQAGCRPGRPPSYRLAKSDVENAINLHNADPEEAMDLDQRFWLIADERTVRGCFRADEQIEANKMMGVALYELPGSTIQLVRSICRVAPGSSLPSGVEIVVKISN